MLKNKIQAIVALLITVALIFTLIIVTTNMDQPEITSEETVLEYKESVGDDKIFIDVNDREYVIITTKESINIPCEGGCNLFNTMKYSLETGDFEFTKWSFIGEAQFTDEEVNIVKNELKKYNTIEQKRNRAEIQKEIQLLITPGRAKESIVND